MVDNVWLSNQYKENRKLFVLFLLAFIINPFVGMLLGLSGYFRLHNPQKTQAYLLMISISAFLGVLNMGKEPFMDTNFYIEYFRRVDNFHLIDSILNYRTDSFFLREPFFNILSVLLHVVLLGNIPLYFFCVTIIIYLLHFVSIYKLFEHFGINMKIIFIPIALMVLFFPMFNQSAHLLRQELASGLLVYAIVQRIITGKNNWLFLFLTLMTHYSTLLFILLSLIPQIYRKLSARLIVGAFFTILILYYMFSYLANLFFSSGMILFFTIGHSMTGLLESNSDSENGTWGIFNLLYFSPLLILSLYNILKIKKTGESILSFSYIYIVLFMLMLVFMSAGVATLQFRYSLYTGSFIPFVIIPILSVLGRNGLSRMKLMVVAYTFIFFYLLYNSKVYSSIGDILTKPFFMYINDSPLLSPTDVEI